jgi:microcystin-dependent protein
MTSYTINKKYVGINIGTFSAIANTVSFTNGVSSDGWVFCDGIAKTNVSKKFDLLINMGIGSVHNTTDYMPPDLTGRIMMGTKCTGILSDLNTYQGASNNNISLSLTNLPAHRHTITIGNSTHTHDLSDSSPVLISDTSTGESRIGDGVAGYQDISGTVTDASNDLHTHTVTVGDVQLTSGNRGDSFSIKNSAFHIQWIVKYI